MGSGGSRLEPSLEIKSFPKFEAVTCSAQGWRPSRYRRQTDRLPYATLFHVTSAAQNKAHSLVPDFRKNVPYFVTKKWVLFWAAAVVV